ncbi:hypothetical protein [Paenibacillus durus]|uniref:Uncharacterized protein n=1 Tax=Paenibacillus durus TaxID=44251 RepID=A0A089HV42_PAEDU|nr:hypothetical protein [Paenibacillus durus]AIQ14932.1 hypothetical protein PDUR_25910 [Paenibacillus durus]
MNIKYSYRISKYNPLNRNDNGTYAVNEWTSLSDVGRTYSGRKFTIEEYLCVEDKYVKAIKIFMYHLNITELQVETLDKWNAELKSTRFHQHYNSTMKSVYSKIQESDIIQSPEIEQITRLILREDIWCKFKYSSDFYVHFGYDYYMYLGGTKDCSKAIEEITHSGLFVEPYESPYWDEE